MTHDEAFEELFRIAEKYGMENLVSISMEKRRFLSGRVETKVSGYVDVGLGDWKYNILIDGPTFESVLDQIARRLELDYTPKVAAEG
jgi:indole-3-glycerol phosphate synthase